MNLNTQTHVTDLLGLIPRYNLSFEPLPNEVQTYVTAISGSELATQYNQAITTVIVLPVLLLVITVILYLIALCACGFSPKDKELRQAALDSQTFENSEQDTLLDGKSKSGGTCCSSFIILVIIITSILSGIAVFFTVSGHETAMQFNNRAVKTLGYFRDYKDELDKMRINFLDSIALFDDIIELEKLDPASQLPRFMEKSKSDLSENQLAPIENGIPSASYQFLDNISQFLSGKVQTEWLRTIFLCVFAVVQFAGCVVGLAGLLRKSSTGILTYICLSLISLVFISLLMVFHLNVMLRTADFCGIEGEGIYNFAVERMLNSRTNGSSNPELIKAYADNFYYCENGSSLIAKTPTKPENVKTSEFTLYKSFGNYLEQFRSDSYQDKLKKIRHFASHPNSQQLIEEINDKLSNAYKSASHAQEKAKCGPVIDDINVCMVTMCSEEMNTWTLLLLTILVLYFCNLIALCAGPNIHNKFQFNSVGRKLIDSKRSVMKARNNKFNSQQNNEFKFERGNERSGHGMSVNEKSQSSEMGAPSYRGLTSVENGAHLRLHQQNLKPEGIESQQFKNPNYDEHSLMKQGVSGRQQYKNFAQGQQENMDLLAEEATFDSIDGIPPPPKMAANPNYQQFDLPN